MSRGGYGLEEEALVRRCVHIRQGAAAADYGGPEYLAALQRLPAGAAVEAARKVDALYWQDAPKVRVRLCADCARHLGM